jgi:hypothetical protein
MLKQGRYAMTNFLDHLNELNPRFICDSGDKESSDTVFEVSHHLGEESSEEDLETFATKLSGDSNEIISFYSMHNGAELYCQNDFPSIEFYRISDMDERNEEWREWFDMYDEDELEEEMYEFQRNGYAFGEIGYSGNYFVWHKGKVYYSDHDGGDDTPVADSFEGFLEAKRQQPAQFLYNMGCYTRFSDGKTDIQWIPREYISG